MCCFPAVSCWSAWLHARLSISLDLLYSHPGCIVDNPGALQWRPLQWHPHGVKPVCNSRALARNNAVGTLSPDMFLAPSTASQPVPCLPPCFWHGLLLTMQTTASLHDVSPSAACWFHTCSQQQGVELRSSLPSAAQAHQPLQQGAAHFSLQCTPAPAPPTSP